jgi:hypothetical protein
LLGVRLYLSPDGVRRGRGSDMMRGGVLAMPTVEHPLRIQGVIREAARELAREENAAIDENVRQNFDLDPARQRRLEKEP